MITTNAFAEINKSNFVLKLNIFCEKYKIEIIIRHLFKVKMDYILCTCNRLWNCTSVSESSVTVLMMVTFPRMQFSHRKETKNLIKNCKNELNMLRFDIANPLFGGIDKFTGILINAKRKNNKISFLKKKKTRFSLSILLAHTDTHAFI